jgi:hypothetical protein
LYPLYHYINIFVCLGSIFVVHVIVIGFILCKSIFFLSFFWTLDLVAKMFPDRKKKHGKQNDCKLRIIIIRSTFPLFCSVRLYSSWPEHHLLTNMAGSLCFVLRQHNCYWPERRLWPVCSDQVGPSFTDTTPHHFICFCPLFCSSVTGATVLT